MHILNEINRQFKKMLLTSRIVIPFAILSLVFATFTQFGFELDVADKIDLFDPFLYIKVSLFTFLYLIINLLLFIIIRIAKSKTQTIIINSNLVSTSYSKKSKYFVLFGTIIAFIVYFAIYCAAYPGYYCYDTDLITYFINTGTVTDAHSPLQIIVCALIMKPILSYTGSWNLAIAVYLFIHMLVFLICVAWINLQLYRLGAPLWLIIFAECYFAFNPLIGMFACCSTKDVMFSIFVVMFSILLYRIISQQKNITSFQVIHVFFFLSAAILYRNNFIYVVIVFIPIFIICFRKNLLEKKYLLINLSIIAALACGFIIKGPVYDYFKVGRSEAQNEMISIPTAQIARSARYDEDLQLTLRECGMDPDVLISAYDFGPENSDNFRPCFYPAKQNMPIIKACWKKAILENPSTSLDASLKLTQAAWQPFRTLRAYNHTPSAYYYDVCKTSLFMCWTEYPGYSESQIQGLQNWLFDISRNEVLETNPLISWITSPAVYLWIVLFILTFTFVERNKFAVVVLLFYLLVFGTYLLGPCVLIRYYFYLILALPFFLCMLFSNKIKTKDLRTPKYEANNI